MFFSIIIPTLNEERFLPDLLRLLLKQKFTSFEVIVVDGMSEDKTIARAESLRKQFDQKKLPLTIVSSEKRNVSYQRNVGADQARGTFLVFFDADVQLPAHFLQIVHDQILARDLTFVTTWVDVDSSDPQDKVIALIHNVVFESSQAVDQAFALGNNIIVKKVLFNSVNGFSENLAIAEDQEFTKKVTKTGTKLTILKEPRLTISLRRYRKEGRLTVLRKYAQTTLHLFLKGPVTTNIFDYEMGGHRYASDKKKRSSHLISLTKIKKQLEKYIKDIEKLSH